MPRIFFVLSFLLAAFAGAAAVAECLPSQMQEADLAYTQAIEFLRSQQYAEAIQRLRSVLDICQDHTPTWAALAMAHKGAGQFEEARTAYETLIAKKGDEVAGSDYASLGQVLARLKLFPEARAALIKAQMLEPDDCNILFNLGVTHYAVEDYRRAVETLEEGVDKCPDIRERLLPQLAKACEKAAAKEQTLGNAARAEVYRQKHQQYAGAAGGSTAYDQVLVKMRAEDYAGAVPLLEAMLQQDPDRKAALLTMARCQSALKKPAAAIPYYERYLVHMPDDHVSTADLMRTYTEAGSPDRAVSLGRESETRFQPMGRRYLAPIYYAWGMAQEALGDFPAAKALFEKCAGCGDAEWTSHAREQIERQDGLIRQQEHRRNQDR